MTPESEGQLGVAPSGEHGDAPVVNPPVRSLAQLESSQAAMRSATRWLVAAVAAVGAVLVAGLQLKNLPYGFKATSVALLGVAAALVSVAFILHRAAGVLRAGYTTFGQIVGLVGEDRYLAQERRQEKWEKRKKDYDAMWKPSKLPPDELQKKTKMQLAGARCIAGIVIPWMYLTRRIEIRRVKDEDLIVDDLISYLNRDTRFFTRDLAIDIQQLSEVLLSTDDEILSLRGEKTGKARRQKQAAARETVSAEKASSHRAPGPNSSTKEAQTGEVQVLLDKAEWRRERLEGAMSVIVAFANQRLLEQRFRKLLLAIFLGGTVVALGAGAFAAAPKLEKRQALSITRPTQVTITVLGKGLSKLCPPGTVLQGVAVGGTWDRPIVVTEKAGTCPAREMTLDHSQAIAVPVLGSRSTSAP